MPENIAVLRLTSKQLTDLTLYLAGGYEGSDVFSKKQKEEWRQRLVALIGKVTKWE
jgi:hypothetical protein